MTEFMANNYKKHTHKGIKQNVCGLIKGALADNGCHLLQREDI